MTTIGLPIALAGDGQQVPCADGTQRPYLSFDAATSTGSLAGVLEAVEAFVPWYSGVDGGAGYKSQASALAYEGARLAALAFAGRGQTLVMSRLSGRTRRMRSATWPAGWG